MLFPIQEVIFAESQGTTPWLSPRRTSSITVVCAKVRSRDTDLLHFWAGEGGGPVGGDGMEGGWVGLVRWGEGEATFVPRIRVTGGSLFQRQPPPRDC